MLSDDLLKIMRTILRFSITVMDASFGGFTKVDRHLHSTDRMITFHAVGHSLPDNLSGIKIDDVG